jgi:single-strand DNA-binding protein
VGKTAIATVQGRVSSDPRITVAKSGTKVANITLGWSHKDREGETKWSNIDVVFFGKTAETVEQYVEKGGEVFVSGDLQAESWVDKEGNPRSKLSIIGSTLTLMGKRSDDSERKTETRPAKPAAKTSKPEKQEDDFPDEVPF